MNSELTVQYENLQHASWEQEVLLQRLADWDVKPSSNFRTSVLKFEFNLHTFDIRILDKNLSTIFM